MTSELSTFRVFVNGVETWFRHADTIHHALAHEMRIHKHATDICVVPYGVSKSDPDYVRAGWKISGGYYD